MALQLDRMTFDEVKEYLRGGPGIAILPVGATEQHGVHGALGTDTFAATCIALKVADRVNGIVLPALAYGNSSGHEHWPGTVGLPPSLLASLARTVCERCIEQGFSVVLMISGHRGNDPAMDVAATEARRDRRAHVLSMSYQDANKGRIHEIVGNLRGGLPSEDIRYGSDGHGGAVESSIAMLYDAAGFRPEKFAKPDRRMADARRGLSFKQTMFIEEYAPDGIFGDSTGTSKELGELIANATADRIAADLKRFLELFPLAPRA